MGKKSALITASATIIAAIIGATVGRVFEQKNIQNEINSVIGDNVNIIGDNSSVSINDISDFVEDYVQLKNQNNSLIEQNEKNLESLNDFNNRTTELEHQVAELTKQLDKNNSNNNKEQDIEQIEVKESSEAEKTYAAKLNELTVSNKYGNGVISGSGKDIWNNEYTDAILLPSGNSGFEFQLKGEYKTLTFTAVLDKRELGDKNVRLCVYEPTGKIQWFNEDLLLEERISYIDRPMQFQINVSGMDFIVIRTDDSIQFDYPIVIISDAILQ